jgi:hypothetical protein
LDFHQEKNSATKLLPTKSNTYGRFVLNVSIPCQETVSNKKQQHAMRNAQHAMRVDLKQNWYYRQSIKMDECGYSNPASAI